MALEARLVQKLGQQLAMTPQLQQAIKLLQMGIPELREQLEKELLENPALEEVRDQEAGSEGPAAGPEALSSPPANTGDTGSQSGGDDTGEAPADGAPTPEAKSDWDDYLDNFIDSRGAAGAKGSLDGEDRPSLEATLTRTENMADYLLGQLRMSDLAPEDEAIAEHIIHNLNRDGYLCETHEAIAEACKVPAERVAAVVEIIKDLDPPGIGARDLKDCLLIQLDHLGLGASLAAKLIRDHLDKLENRKYDQIVKAEGVTLEDISRALSVIQRLEPRPGRQFIDDETRYIVPDIYVQKVGNEYVISLNEDGLPKLRISPYYADLLRKGTPANDEAAPNKAYFNERLKAAQWLLKSIQQRQQTIFKVTESIVKFQRDFLDKGIDKLRPLVLKEVADDIGMHESTVSRVTSNKYVHTPQGVFELKYFFTTGIMTSSGEVSSSSIKERIRILIAAESPDAPISDQQIAEIFKKDNVDIARRTVAKYREGLGILPSSKRKRML